MAEPKRKLTKAENKRKAALREQYEWIFVRGKQVRVRRPQLIDGMLEDDWIEENADDYWLHQNGLWEVIHARQMEEQERDQLDQLDLQLEAMALAIAELVERDRQERLGVLEELSTMRFAEDQPTDESGLDCPASAKLSR